MMTTDNDAQEKTLRLVEYLAALARINSKITRSIGDYRKILWIHNIPHEPKHCYTQAWKQEDDHDEDVWIEIIKFQEPNLPEIPIKCEDWVNYEALRNLKELPELHETIVVEHIEQDPETGEEFRNNETLFLGDSPDVQQAWDVYLEKKWLPWAELYERYSRVQGVYADLFHIYQEQQKLGEQYELVFCLGLLSWKIPGGYEVKRHIIVSKASLEFEAHLGKFTVKQAIDGDQADVELDMLDIQDQPQNIRQLVEEGRSAIGSNLWDRSNVDAVLSSIANSLADSGQGEYQADSFEPQHVVPSEKPLIEYAPALILRKRSTRGLEQLLASMKEQIEAGVSIPSEFQDLSETSTNKKTSPSDGKTEKDRKGISEVYFPLPANEEQRRIIHTLDYQNGVLVQGPPGTGKSHTIANLICHLLATGKRVLVTAKTPRALQVLHDKLTSEIKPLCINLLGRGTEERESLEKSVTGILTRLDRKREANNNERIQSHENQLYSNRTEKTKIDNKIFALREAETYQHAVAGGSYSGTAADIARTLKKEEELCSWFTDVITQDDPLPLSDPEIGLLCENIVGLDAETEKELSLFLPDPSKDLPDIETVRVAFQKEAKAREKVDSNIQMLSNAEGKALQDAGREKIESLQNNLSELAIECKNVCQRPMAWIKKAVYDVLTDRDTPWKELLTLSVHRTEKLHDISVMVDSTDVVIPHDIPRKKLLHDAKALKAHFDAGGGKGIWLFKPKSLREHGDFIGKVKVDGLDCDNAETLQTLIDYLTVELDLDYVWSLWSGKTERHKGPFPLQIAEIDELHEALQSVISLYERREKTKQCLQNIHGLGAPHWEDVASLNSLAESCTIALANLDYLSIKKQLQQLGNRISTLASRENAHPINDRIYQAFQKREIDMRIPRHSGHPFHAKAASDSMAFRPPIPDEAGHLS